MKARIVLMVLTILGVIAYLVLGPGRPLFGPDARSAAVQSESEDLAVRPSPMTMTNAAVPPPKRAESAVRRSDEYTAEVAVPPDVRVEWRTIEFTDGNAVLTPVEIVS